MSIEAKSLGVTYKSRTGNDLTALQDIDLRVEEGEFVTLIGPSGCGKSTLLHSLGGMLKPTRGEVLLDGRKVTEPDPRKAAFIFQDYSLLPWKTILDNAAIGLRFANLPKGERQAKAHEMLELVGLANFAKSYPHELSGGMQQRVAVARAMAMEPEVLLMDEPFGALDEQTRQRLGYQMSKILTTNNKGVVMVTHSLDEAIFWADRIVVMSPRPGRIVREIIVDEPRPREVSFIADPRFSLIRQELFTLISEANEQANAQNNGEPLPIAPPEDLSAATADAVLESK
jgi:NitT/TauT family transport system ATP-binding protein